MATMLDSTPTTNLLHACSHNGIPPPFDSTQFWLNPLNISRTEKDTLVQTLRDKQKPKTTRKSSHTNTEFKPHPQPTTHTRRPSKPQVSRENVSPQRAKHLERNRVAANKCRLKKKKEHEQIQCVLNNETAKRDTLLAEVDFLKEEIWHLKNRMFEHAKCDDQQINLQLVRMTQSVLEGNPNALPCPSPTFSVSTCSDGSLVVDGGMDTNGSVSATLPMDEPPAYEGYPDGIFDSFVDVPTM